MKLCPPLEGSLKDPPSPIKQNYFCFWSQHGRGVGSARRRWCIWIFPEIRDQLRRAHQSLSPRRQPSLQRTAEGAFPPPITNAAFDRSYRIIRINLYDRKGMLLEEMNSLRLSSGRIKFLWCFLPFKLLTSTSKDLITCFC